MDNIKQWWKDSSVTVGIVLSTVTVLLIMVIIMIVLQQVGYGPYDPNTLVEPITIKQRAKYQALLTKLSNPGPVSDTGTSADYNLTTADDFLKDANKELTLAFDNLQLIKGLPTPDLKLQYAEEADTLANSAVLKLAEGVRLLELAKKDILELQLAVPTVERLTVSTVGQAQDLIEDLNERLKYAEIYNQNAQRDAVEIIKLTSDAKAEATTNMNISTDERETVRSDVNEIYIRMVAYAAELSFTNKNLLENNVDIRFARNSGNTDSVSEVYEGVESKYAEMQHIYNALVADASMIRSNLAYIKIPDDQARPMLLNVEAVMETARRQMDDAGYIKDGIYESLQMAKAIQENNVEGQANFLRNNIERWNVKILSGIRDAQELMHSNDAESIQKDLKNLMIIEDDIINLNRLISGDFDDLKAISSEFTVQQQTYDNSQAQITNIQQIISNVESKAIHAEAIRVSELENTAFIYMDELSANLSELNKLANLGNVIVLDASNATIDNNIVELESLSIQANSIQVQAALYYETCLVNEVNIKNLLLNETYPKFNSIVNQAKAKNTQALIYINEIDSIVPSLNNMKGEVMSKLSLAKSADISQIINDIVMYKDVTLRMRDRADADFQDAESALLSLNGSLIQMKLDLITDNLVEAQNALTQVLNLIGHLTTYDSHIAVQVYQSDSVGAVNHIVDIQKNVRDMVDNLTVMRTTSLMNDAREKITFMQSHKLQLNNIMAQGRYSSNSVSEAQSRLNANSISSTATDYGLLLGDAERSYIHIDQTYESLQTLVVEGSIFTDILNEANDLKQSSTILINEIRSFNDQIEGIYETTQSEKLIHAMATTSVFVEQINAGYNEISVYLNESQNAVNTVSLTLSDAKNAETEQLARFQAAGMVQADITASYLLFRDFLSANQQLEIGTQFQISKDKEQEAGIFLNQINVMTQQVAQSRISLQANLISETFSRVNNLIGSIEYKNNELSSLVAQSEIIIANVNGVITTEEPIYVLDYISDKDNVMSQISIATNNVISEITTILEQLDQITVSINLSEIDAMVDDAHAKFQTYVNKLDIVEQNQVSLTNLLADARLREAEIRTKINTALGYLSDMSTLSNSIVVEYNEGIILYNTISTAMTDYNWTVVETWGPYINNVVNAVDPKFEQVVYFRNSILDLLTSGHPDSNNVLINAEEIYLNSLNMLNDLRTRAQTVNGWVGDVLVINSLLNILSLQESNTEVARNAKNAGLQIRAEANSLYSSYQWDVLNTKLEDLLTYKDNTSAMLSIVEQQHFQIMSVPSSGYINNIRQQSSSNVNEIQSALTSLNLDISTLTNLINQSSQMQQVESYYSETLNSNAVTVNNVINQSMANIHTLNSLAEMGTNAANSGNTTAVYQYKSQADSVMSDIINDYQGLGSIVEDSEQIMNDYVRDLDNFDQNNFDSIKSGYASMSTIIAAAENIQSNWQQIIANL